MLLMDTVSPSACGDSWNSEERRPVLVFKSAPIIRNYSAWTGHSETRETLSLSLQDSNFHCVCLLLEKKPWLVLPVPLLLCSFGSTWASRQNSCHYQSWHHSRAADSESQDVFPLFLHTIEENRKLRLADHFIFNFHASLSPPTQAKTIDLHGRDFLHEGFKEHWRELLNKNI